MEGLFASPILPDAATHVIRIVDDLAQRYPVDGVHLDYIRYPGPQFDYSLGALQAFRQDLDGAMTPAERRRFDPSSVAALIAATDTYPDRWAGFRRSRLNALVMRLRTVVKERRPDAIVSAAVYPDAQEALTHRFQDWSMWVENRWIDVVCPMAYTPEAGKFAERDRDGAERGGRSPGSGRASAPIGSPPAQHRGEHRHGAAAGEPPASSSSRKTASRTRAARPPTTSRRSHAARSR